ncbi:MAG: metal-dependent transcriptional regulator [Bacilli bacterium]
MSKEKQNKSVEDYLEAILVLSQSNDKVRSIDIAKNLDFSKASVSVAMHNLLEKEYIKVDNNKCIFLTKSGREIAEKIYERHILISRWLEHLGISKEIAVDDACNIEHVISPESFKAIKDFLIKNKEILK